MLRKIGRVIGAVLGTLLMLALLGAVLAPAALVEAQGQVTPGEVVAKREEITMRRTGWSRQIFVEVRYQPAGAYAPEVALIPVTARRYDQIRVEQAVQVRHLPDPTIRALGTLAATRLADQPPFGALLEWLEPAAGFLATVVAGVALLLAAVRWPRWWLVTPAAAVIAGGLVLLIGDWPPPAPAGPQLAASATVRDTHEVDQIFWRRTRGRVDAAQPYTIVELSFTPRGAAGPVVAVDQIDQGSVAGLAPGATVPVHYSGADPRWAQIDGAARSYPWKNLAGVALPAAVILALLAGLALLWRSRRRGGTVRP